jgi:hypothetical protein
MNISDEVLGNGMSIIVNCRTPDDCRVRPLSLC